MKKETLEEAAEKYAGFYRCPATNEEEYCRHDIISAINFGAEWQKKRSYSEEEVENILIEYVKTNPSKPYRVVSWFTQFKRNNK